MGKVIPFRRTRQAHPAHGDKAIVAHPNGKSGYAVSIVPAETPEEKAWGAEFASAAEAVDFATEYWRLFGKDAGLVLIDATREVSGGGCG